MYGSYVPRIRVPTSSTVSNIQHQGGWKSVWYLCAPNQSSNIQHSIQHSATRGVEKCMVLVCPESEFQHPAQYPTFSNKGGGKVYGTCVPRIRVPTSSTVSNISASRGVEKCMVVVCPESEFQHPAQNPTFSNKGGGKVYGTCVPRIRVPTSSTESNIQQQGGWKSVWYLCAPNQSSNIQHSIQHSASRGVEKCMVVVCPESEFQHPAQNPTFSNKGGGKVYGTCVPRIRVPTSSTESNIQQQGGWKSVWYLCAPNQSSNIQHSIQHSASRGVEKCMVLVCPESEFQHPAQYPTFSIKGGGKVYGTCVPRIRVPTSSTVSNIQQQGGWKSVWYLCAPNQSSNIQHSIQHFSIKGGGKVYGSCVPRIRVPTSSTESNIQQQGGWKSVWYLCAPNQSSNIQHRIQHSATRGVEKCMVLVCPESEFQHPAQYPTFSIKGGGKVYGTCVPRIRVPTSSTVSNIQQQGGWKSVWYLCAPNQSSNIQHSIQHFSIKGGGKVYGSCVPQIRVPTSSTESNIQHELQLEFQARCYSSYNYAQNYKSNIKQHNPSLLYCFKHERRWKCVWLVMCKYNIGHPIYVANNLVQHCI